MIQSEERNSVNIRGKSFLITGGAGFIGSNLAELLLENGNQVVIADNFSLGDKNNISWLKKYDGLSIYEMDVRNIEQLQSIIHCNYIEGIFHLAANSDIQKSLINPSIDFDNTFLTTYSVLQAMRDTGVQKMFFASTSAVYGDKEDVSLSESIGELSPISYYGSAKLASEVFISSYSYLNNLDITVMRFANVIGRHATHGVIFDFLNKLSQDSSELEILGDGRQTKPYIYIDDLIEAMLMLYEKEHGMNIYNVGVDSRTSVTEIADMVCEGMGLKNVKYRYTGGTGGWQGDVPAFKYDLRKIHRLGWKAKYSSNEAVNRTIKDLLGGIR